MNNINNIKNIDGCRNIISSARQVHASLLFYNINAPRLLDIAVRISAVIIVGVLLTSVSASGLRAELITNAKVTVSSANIRTIPGTGSSSTVIATVTLGTRVYAGDLVLISGDPNGYNSWYQVSAVIGSTQYDGYIVSSFIQKDPTVTDPVFEESIAGFPESYKQSLRSLHEAHPSWVFNALNVPTDWNTVVAAESTLGTSLITSSANDAWKSTEPKAYNWLTNIYTPYDGTSWVNASQDVVAHYMDPRNFLSETYVFQFLNLSYDPATQTQEAVQKLLLNTFMASALITDPATNTQIPYAQAFMQAGAVSGSSPYQLVSRVIQEVSAQGSRSTSGIEPGYEGHYNFYNIGASSSVDPVVLGLTFAIYGSNNPLVYPMSAENQIQYMIPWNSPFRSIVGGAKYVSNNYIQKGQNTLYLQKFDVIDDGNGMYWHQYMTNIQAMIGESTILYNAYSKSNLLDSPLTFSIPVYSNMPASAVAQPAKTGNPNNYLASLSVEGNSLTPTFDASVTDGYTLIVPDIISSANLTAVPVAATSSVSGTGIRTLNVGANPAAISVTAQNGSVRTYNITIIRSEQSGEALFTTSYNISPDNTISGISPGTTVSALTGGITLQNGGQIVYASAAGSPIIDSAHILGTGDRVQFYNASAALVYDFTVIIYGDANRDGNVSSSDLTVICRHILKRSNLTGAALWAADANRDGNISSSDLTVVCRHILKKSNITQ